jgi:hypothetical protein
MEMGSLWVRIWEKSFSVMQVLINVANEALQALDIAVGEDVVWMEGG